MATSSIKNQIYIKTKTVTGTSSNVGSISLGLSASEYTVIAVKLIGKGSKPVPFTYQGGWFVNLYDTDTTIDYCKPMTGIEYELEVTYF